MNDTSIKSYDYNLPKEQIAETPLLQRHSSKLLHLNLKNDTTNESQFYFLAAAVGILMGGIQSLSRSTFTKLIPSEINDNASFFNFYAISYNISVVIGTFSYGYIEQITGSMRTSILALMFFFIIGLLILLFTRIKR